MSNKTIYDALLAAGMTKEGACAVLGNMAAESGMKPDIAQRGMTALSDEAYTASADNGLIDFARDGVGYGLCQWTWPPRKAELLAFAQSRGLSVGDSGAQTAFCLAELQRDYPRLWRRLCSEGDLYQLTEAVCTEYERPAVNNVGARYEFARQALRCFGETPTQPEEATVAPEGEPELAAAIMQLVMRFEGCWPEELDGRRTERFRARLAAYARGDTPA